VIARSEAKRFDAGPAHSCNQAEPNMSEPFDDQPQWYWAADTGRASGQDVFQRADDRFVVACGQRELWSRVRREIDRDGHCAWHSFGPESGKPTLADCMAVFLSARTTGSFWSSRRFRPLPG